ncbi:MAG: sulfotransferase domain-containing protein [Balneolaceae bacterium]|nr:sulfotransferase domain-containing protein [Balneolaceae bacterium]
MKSGTTSLHYYLRNNSNLFLPLVKELNYFIEEWNYKKGIDWYTSHFHKIDIPKGEASPDYTKAHIFEGVPERMYKLLPEIKLIYLYRDPVERAYSHYLHLYATGFEKRSIKEAMVPGSDYILTSKYYWQIRKFLEFYKREQLLFIDSSRLRNDRKKVMKEICDFIGVKNDFKEKVLNKELHLSKDKTKRSKLNKLIFNSSVGIYLKKRTPESMKKIYRNISENKMGVPVLDEHLKKELYSILEEDYAKFEELLV